MTTTLVIDTETNGKPPPRDQIGDLSAWPWMIQLAAVLFDGRRPVATYSMFTLPIDMNGRSATIPREKFFLDNGLTNEIVGQFGTTYVDAIGHINRTLLPATDRIVAHNKFFDRNVIKAAYARAEMADDAFRALPMGCTMMPLTAAVGATRNGRPKWPTLDEAYRKLVDPAGFEGAHDALADCMACARVLWAAEDLGIDCFARRDAA